MGKIYFHSRFDNFIFFSFVFSVINRNATLGQAFPMWFLSLFTFIPLVYLFKFSKDLKESLENSDEIILKKAIQNLKSYFKSIGISMILVFVCFVVLILSVFIFDFFKSI